MNTVECRDFVTRGAITTEVIFISAELPADKRVIQNPSNFLGYT